MSKQDAIKKERDKLNKIFENIPENKKSLVEGLIKNAAFMAVTLTDLQEEVINNGSVIPCQSGNGFETIKDNPAQKAYTTMVARYAQIINQLQNLLPDSKSEGIAKAGENLARLVAGGRPVELR